jgi:hypothetical protein
MVSGWCMARAMSGACAGLDWSAPTSTRAPPCCWAWLGLLPGLVGLGGGGWGGVGWGVS